MGYIKFSKSNLELMSPAFFQIKIKIRRCDQKYVFVLKTVYRIKDVFKISYSKLIGDLVTSWSRPSFRGGSQ